MDRRAFIAGLSATALAPRAAIASETPSLRLGVLSDTHVSVPGLVAIDPHAKPCLETGAAFERALLAFRKRGVDAVVIAGDLTEFGLVEELDEVARIWSRVFPGDCGADGKKVEKAFILGNHDAIAWGWKSTYTGELWKGAEKSAKWNASIGKDPAAAWGKCFGEDYAPLQIKTICGHKFVLAHWLTADPGDGDWNRGAETPGIEAFIAAHRAELAGARPFFYVQHAHPQGTCLPFACCDRGAATRALSEFPNAVAFSGHAHQPLTDDRNVWQGAFTSIGTASLLDAGGRSWRENGSPYAKGASTLAHMPYLKTSDCQHGQYVRVYGDRLEIERLDFNWGLSLGPDWVVPMPAAGKVSFGGAERRRSAPQFAAGSAVVAAVEGDLVKVRFPSATAGGRTYDYEARAVLLADDYDAVAVSKRILAPDYHLPPAKAGRPGEVWFARAELPPKSRIRFEVRPVDCFGASGDAIAADFST